MPDNEFYKKLIKLEDSVGIDLAKLPKDLLESIEPDKESKSLTPDQKRLHWEVYAQKTERQGEVFKRVFENVFDEQKDLVVAELKRTGKLPSTLNDEVTAQKFEPAIELVYESAFEGAV